mmetsp:Transcript_54855/g.128236  ORF Transcript_54855/g.128236 Transcript_54855/m.128236 type:complete len:245 (+) Transcript_54855:1482-2216(+)
MNVDHVLHDRSPLHPQHKLSLGGGQNGLHATQSHLTSVQHLVRNLVGRGDACVSCLPCSSDDPVSDHRGEAEHVADGAHDRHSHDPDLPRKGLADAFEVLDHLLRPRVQSSADGRVVGGDRELASRCGCRVVLPHVRQLDPPVLRVALAPDVHLSGPVLGIRVDGCANCVLQPKPRLLVHASLPPSSPFLCLARPRCASLQLLRPAVLTLIPSCSCSSSALGRFRNGLPVVLLAWPAVLFEGWY